MVNFLSRLYHKKVYWSCEKGVYMKEVLQKFSADIGNNFAKPVKDKFLGFVHTHPEIFCLSLIAVFCLLLLFFGLDFYPLLDVDETRYAVMARDLAGSFDWSSLMLNGQPFLEKPPLYFWLVASSIKFFGHFSEIAVRLPIALLSSFITFFTYYVGKKVISRKFGVISALTLISSAFFLIFSHIAILDMVLTVLVTSALYCGFLTHFCEAKFKKYLWWYFYLFIGVGFLAKGILAFAIPVTVMFAYNLIAKTLKDAFKPIHVLPGLVIFSIIAIPWHYVMYLEYGNRFIKEYFLLHHFARFINSESIGRIRPFWYFIPVFFFGFMPWSFVFVAFLVDGFKKLTAKFKSAEGSLKSKLFSLVDAQTNEQKLLLFASLYFVIVFLVFSSSSTKLPTYILPVFPAAALLTGYFWWASDEKRENSKAISVATHIFAIVLLVAGIAGTIASCVLPYDIMIKVADFRSATVTGIYLLAIFLLLRLNTKRALSVFAAYLLVMIFVISLSVSHIFNLVYAGGENEIVRYSMFARGGDSQLVTFDFAVKPSAMIGYKSKVVFLTDPDFKLLDDALNYKKGPTFVIVKNVNLEDEDYSKKIQKRLEFVNRGDRYSLFVKDVNDVFKKSQMPVENVNEVMPSIDKSKPKKVLAPPSFDKPNIFKAPEKMNLQKRNQI